MAKRIALCCSESITAIIVGALRNYIDVAFPPGSSDCAQVARESLLDTVSELEMQRQNAAVCHYNARLRAMVKEAVKLHYQISAHDLGRDCAQQCAVVLAACQGLAVTDADLQTACDGDLAAAGNPATTG